MFKVYALRDDTNDDRVLIDVFDNEAQARTVRDNLRLLRDVFAWIEKGHV